MSAPDISGQRFGILTVLRRAANKPDGSSRWNCVCDCGARRTIAATGLRAGRHKSCGCASPRFKPQLTTLLGISRTRTYRIWYGMLRRCADLTEKNYAGKGIKVCPAWHDFARFLADMGEAPCGLSIDRRDGNRDYEPSNCRWATAKTQGNNTSANRRVIYQGQDRTVAEWAPELGIKANTLIYRLRRGWTTERAFAQPVQERSHAN